MAWFQLVILNKGGGCVSLGVHSLGGALVSRIWGKILISSSRDRRLGCIRGRLSLSWDVLTVLCCSCSVWIKGDHLVVGSADPRLPAIFPIDGMCICYYLTGLQWLGGVVIWLLRLGAVH